MAFDIGQTASSVYGIAGMGIGLGVLAGTTGMVMRSMERNIYGDRGEDRRRPYSYMRREEGEEEEEEYRRPRPRTRTYQKRKTTKRKTSKKRKTTRTYRRDEHEERPRYGGFSPSPYRSPRLNIPQYW